MQGVAIRPGHPVVLGLTGSTPVIGVPGYPVSAALAFELFGVRLVAALGDRQLTPRPRVQAVAPLEIPSTTGSEEWVRVRVGRVGGDLVAIPLRRGAGVLSSLARADGLVRVALGAGPSRVRRAGRGRAAPPARRDRGDAARDRLDRPAARRACTAAVPRFAARRRAEAVAGHGRVGERCGCARRRPLPSRARRGERRSRRSDRARTLGADARPDPRARQSARDRRDRGARAARDQDRQPAARVLVQEVPRRATGRSSRSIPGSSSATSARRGRMPRRRPRLPPARRTAPSASSARDSGTTSTSSAWQRRRWRSSQPRISAATSESRRCARGSRRSNAATRSSGSVIAFSEPQLTSPARRFPGGARSGARSSVLVAARTGAT